MITMACQSGFKSINIFGQNTFYDFRGDRLLSYFIGLLKSKAQVIPNLKRCGQLFSQ